LSNFSVEDLISNLIGALYTSEHRTCTCPECSKKYDGQACNIRGRFHYGPPLEVEGEHDITAVVFVATLALRDGLRRKE